MKIARIVPGNKPQGLPYPIDRVKEFLRVTGTDQDGVIAKLITAAAERIEHECWVVIGSRTYTAYLDDFCSDVILHKYPISAINSVQYYDSSNELQTLSTDDYYTDIQSDNARIYFENEPNVYDDRYNAVQINFTAGYSNWYDVPDEFAHLLMVLVHESYDGRQQDTKSVGERLLQTYSRRIPT